MLRTAWRKTVDLLYPERCLRCGEFGTCLCQVCALTMTPARGPGRCPFCCARWDGELNCPRCALLQSLEGVRAAFEMEGPARALVHAFKYEGVRAAGLVMVESLRPVVGGLAVDGVYAVPLHRSRQRRRGFNQAEELLISLGCVRGAGVLRRVRKTATQVGMHLGERRDNVAGAFAYDGPDLKGGTVALIDDVVTTGATANECAAVLREAGARRVFAVAFARASYNPDPRAAPSLD